MVPVHFVCLSISFLCVFGMAKLFLGIVWGVIIFRGAVRCSTLIGRGGCGCSTKDVVGGVAVVWAGTVPCSTMYMCGGGSGDVF